MAKLARLHPMSAELLTFPTPTALANEAARRFVAAIPDNREFFVALSGGRISKLFYQEIVVETRRVAKNLGHVHFFFADERCVPPTDPESNFLTARQFLFDPLHIRAEQIHRVHGEVEDEYAAKEAEAELCRLAPMDAVGQPILDLVILGMGEDGHTASLFPGESHFAIDDPAVYRAVTAVKPPPRRITLGYAPLRAAADVWVLASGNGKETALRRVLADTNEPPPLGRVLRARRNSLIFSDIPGSDNFPQNL
jgi:6-phosphogluconolactonase